MKFRHLEKLYNEGIIKGEPKAVSIKIGGQGMYRANKTPITTREFGGQPCYRPSA